MASRWAKLLILTIVIGAVISDCFARSVRRTKKQARNPLDKLLILQRRETTPVNFSRLVAMRIIYGLASMVGLRERIGGVLNGAFVPPGVEDDDYGFGLDDDDDDIDVGEFFDI